MSFSSSFSLEQSLSSDSKLVYDFRNSQNQMSISNNTSPEVPLEQSLDGLSQLVAVKDNIFDYGTTSKNVLDINVPINAMIGDQQAAAIGQNCINPAQRMRLAELLTRYSCVFSIHDGDVGTTIVELRIPMKNGARPIRQQPHRLGPFKEEQAKKKCRSFSNKSLLHQPTELGARQWS